MLSIQSYWILLVIIILVCLIIPTRRKFMMNLINKKRKGEKKLPTEMLQEFIGKECIITIFSDLSAVQGKIITVEENWIKVEEKKKIRIINGDMIKDISTLK